LTGRQPERYFDELMLGYLEATAGKSHAARDIYTARHLQEFFAGLSMVAIGRGEIGEYRRRRAVEGAADGTVRRELGLLSRAVNYARREWGWEITNPVSGRLPPPPPGRLRWLRREEYERLLKAARANPRAPWLADFIEFAVHTGMRRGEILGLEWRRVDLGERVAYLNPEHQKGRRYNAVPLNDRAVAILRKRFAARERPKARYVFEYRKHRIASLKTSFGRARAAAGLEDVTIHDLRHTCGAWLVQAGVPIRTVAEVLRHRDIATTMRYAHLAPEDARAAVDVLAQREPIVNPEGDNARNPAIVGDESSRRKLARR